MILFYSPKSFYVSIYSGRFVFNSMLGQAWNDFSVMWCIMCCTLQGFYSKKIGLTIKKRGWRTPKLSFCSRRASFPPQKKYYSPFQSTKFPARFFYLDWVLMLSRHFPGSLVNASEHFLVQKENVNPFFLIKTGSPFLHKSVPQTKHFIADNFSLVSFSGRGIPTHANKLWTAIQDVRMRKQKPPSYNIY